MLSTVLYSPSLAQSVKDVESQTASEHQSADTATVPIVRVVVVGDLPRRPRPLVPLYASLAGLATADAYMTLWGVRHGAVEKNPMMRSAAHNPYALVGLKAATTATTVLLTEQVWSDHPKRAVWTMIGINLANGWLVWHNSRVIGRVGNMP